jgi:hypothetical protein
LASLIFYYLAIKIILNDSKENVPGNTAIMLYFIFTAARWPNFRPNNSKEAQKNCLWPEKLEAVKWQNLAKSGRKEAGN